MKIGCSEESFVELYRHGYTAMEEIGSGASGVVLKARRGKGSKLVAVKVVDKRCITAFMRRSLALEVLILGRVKTDRISQLVDVVDGRKYLYIVMEYISGGDLHEQMSRMTSGFEEHEALKIMEGVLEALVHLHECGFAHRDIKLENIMLADENPAAPKLIDFGLAYSQHRFKSDLCTEFLGTPIYTSPEVASLTPYVPWQADIWALGVVLHELLTQKSPFQGVRRRQLFKDIVQRQLQLKGSPWDTVSEDTQKLLLSMLNKDGAKRPSAADCLELVRKILRAHDQGQPGPAPASLRTRSRFTGFLRFHRPRHV